MTRRDEFPSSFVRQTFPPEERADGPRDPFLDPRLSGQRCRPCPNHRFSIQRMQIFLCCWYDDAPDREKVSLSTEHAHYLLCMCFLENCTAIGMLILLPWVIIISSNNSDSTDSTDTSLLNLCWLSLQLSCQEKNLSIHLSLEQYATKLVLENQFGIKYMMSDESIMHRVILLEPPLKLPPRVWIVVGNKQYPLSILGTIIWWQSGSSFHDIRDSGSFSWTPFIISWRRVLMHCWIAKKYRKKRPATKEEIVKVFQSFHSTKTENLCQSVLGH